MATAEADKRELSRTLSEWGAHEGNLDVDESVTDDYVSRLPTFSEHVHDPKGAVSMVRTAFPEIEYTVKENIVEEDTVVR